MKYLYFLFVLPFALACTATQTQPSAEPVYKTWIYDLSGKMSVKGILYSVSDSSIIVINSASREDINAGKISRSEIPVEQIQTIKIRHKGQIGKEMGLGFISGFIIGFTLPQEESEDVSFMESLTQSVGLGLILAPITSIGIALFGGGREKIDIDGNKVTYWALKENINRYAINKQPEAPKPPIIGE